MKHSFKDFLPLIAILALIVLVSGGILIWFFPSAGVFTAMRIFMGVFLVTFGGFKLVKLPAFVTAYQEYDLLAKQSRAYGYLYPFMELSLGVFFLFGVYLAWVAAFTALLMLVSAAGVFNKLRENETVPCACLGTVFTLPMTYVTLGEDLGMAAMSVALLVMIL